MGNEASTAGREALEKYKSILPDDAQSWLHWDYIVYLKKSVEEGEPWKDQKFFNLLNTQSKKVPVNENGKFCKWKDIQKEIFDAVMKKHNHVPYTWEDHAEGVLNNSNKTKSFNILNCSKSDIPEEDTKTPINGCNFNTVELSTCLPLRRRDIYLDGIESNMKSIESIMTSMSSANITASMIFGIMASSLGRKAEEEIHKLKKAGKKDAEICKIMQRNFADYKDLFDGKDIVSYKKSRKLQCKLKKIHDKLQNQLSNERKYNILWNNYFKNPTDKLLKDIKNEDAKICQLYNESQTENQCLRFLEEWFEEFLRKKQNIQNDLIRACLYNEKKVVKTKGGMAQLDCKFYCNAYGNFLQSNKKCYDNYRKECIRNISKNKNMDEDLAKADIHVLLKKIKRKTNCDESACGNEYEPHLNGLFNKNIDYLHKGYHCGCSSENKKKSIFEKGTNNIFLEEALNELSFCAVTDDDLDGTIGGKGEKVLTKSTDGSDVKGICDVDYYDSFIRKSKFGNPCIHNRIDSRGWMCDGTRRSVGTILTEWKDKACLPPRTQALCLGYLHVDNNGTTYNKIDTIDSNEKLLTELIYAANVEGQNLKKYFASRHNHRYRDHRLCNALKYSFADLGDVVRGRSIWENIYTKSMETNLKAIFERIYNKLPSEKQSIYKNDKSNPRDTNYLRETWWNTNREYIWKALLCGAGMEKYNPCGGSVPNIDYMPQFLRWLTEWSADFCEEKNTYDIKYPNPKNPGEDKNIESMCKGCYSEGGRDCLTSYPQHGHASSNITCSKCRTRCRKYTEWIKNQKKEYEKQKTKYELEIQKSRTNKRHNILYNSKNITEFFKKIEKTYPYVNTFLQEQLKETGCDQNVESIDFEKEQSTFNLKHNYCRSCDEQKHLEDAIGGPLLPDGRPGKPPYGPISTETTVGPTHTTGSQNVPGRTVSGTSGDVFKEQKEKHECDEIFDGNWNEWDCTKTNIKRQSVCMKKNDTNYNNEFFILFNEWIENFLNEHKQFQKNIEKCTNNKGGNLSNCPDEKCRNECHCYNKWAHNKQNEWNSQKEFYKTNNIGSFEGLSLGGFDLDLYLGTLDYFNDFGIHENMTPSYEILKKINDAIHKSEECVKKCPKPIKCEDKGFDNNWKCADTPSSLGFRNKSMCLRKGDDKYEKPNLDKLEMDYKFYDVFNEWLDDMQRMLEDNMQILKSSCRNQYIRMKNNKPNSHKNNNNMCNICRDDCNCYDDLKTKINDQWGKQKKYFEIYRTFDENMMKNIDLDMFLEAQCEYNLTEMGNKLEIAEKQCKKKDKNKDTIFDEMVDNIHKKKDKVCDVCKEENKYDQPVDDAICNKISDIENSKCRTKDYDDKKDGNSYSFEKKKNWDCKSNKKRSTEIEKYVCVPPRGQALCVANMADSQGIKGTWSTEDDLKTRLKEAIKTETKRLHEYYQGKNGKSTTSTTPPPGFCDAVYRSFNDYKHMVLGDMLWKPRSIGALDNKIKTIIERVNTGTTREQWWEKNEKEFWNAIKCGIKDSGKKSVANLTGNECPRLINDDDQFEWWAKEWSDDFYEKRKTLADKVEEKCGSGKNGCNGAGGTTATGECGTKCAEYKCFLTLKRKEWKDNFKKYLDDKEKPQNKNSYDDEKMYMPHNFYLLYPCTYQSCDGKHIKDLLGNKDHGELQNKCTCDTSQQTQEQNDPCSDKFEFHACNDKKYDLGLWSSTYVTNPRDRNKVYAPPRRNSICIGWLFSPLDTSGRKDKAKNELKNKVIDAAKGEAHYLWKKYTSGSNTNTAEYCESLKRSFADIGDMVKGTDMWTAGYSPLVEQNIYNVFALSDTSGGSPKTRSEKDILEERKQWWESIRKDVWKGMSKCNDTYLCGDTAPEDDEKPQFLRWLEEWGEYICEERKKHLDELKNKCNDGKDVENDKTCDRGSKDCKKECYKYNNWINIYKREWSGQSKKYKEIYDNKDESEYKDYEPYINRHANANKYIGKSNNECKNSGTSSGGSNNINLDDVFQKRDEEYKKYEPFCTTCRVNEIAETVKKKQKRGRANPCANPSGFQPTTSVEHIAKTLQGEAKNKLVNSSGLEGDISQAKFKGINSDLNKDKICDLKKEKHTNDSREYEDKADGKNGKHSGPCTGKGTGKEQNKQRFAVGLQWKPPEAGQVDPNHNGVLFPPRRLDMCTSNLEFLDTTYPRLSDADKAKHSLLGDVMLAAKTEAETIIELYKKQKGGQGATLNQKDKECICRSMKYSFADLGDIIRGRDLWSKNPDMVNLENKLKAIFKNMKENVDDIKNNDKYKSENPPYKTLREDWWTANRDQIWNAMMCAKINGSTTPCNDPTKPIDDYIPQRLRWMTEWAENYCRAQKKHYDELVKACGGCKDIKKGGTCDKCKECKAKCQEYEKEVAEWKEQWTEMDTKYKDLYKNAKDNKGNGGNDENEKYLNLFLYKLQTLNKDNTTYESSAGYIHDIGNFNDCQQQNVFCNDSNDHYAFKYPPHKYKDQCTCTTPAKPAAVRPPAAGAAKPVATKPEVPRPQAAKPAATKPATTKQSGGESQGSAGTTPSPPSGRGSAARSENSNTSVISTTKTSDGATVTTTVSFTPSAPDNAVDPDVKPDPNNSPPQGTSTSSSADPQPQSPPQPPTSTQSPAPQNPDSSIPNQNRNIPSGMPIFRTSVDSDEKSDDAVNQSRSSNKVKKSTYPMNCVEKAANYLRIEAENNIKDVKNTLIGTKTGVVYTTEQDDWTNNGNCKINDTTTGQTYNCDGNGNPFDDKTEWDCEKKKNNVPNEHICLPPRRKHMCTKALEQLNTSTITTSDALFKDVLRTAAYEGKHLKEVWEKIPNGTPKKMKPFLCDAMKYSFADLGDIIRGRDMLIGSNGTNSIERKLKEVFEKLKKEWVSKNGEKHKDKYPDVSSFRSAWWDANRVSIWEAMTCSAPYNASLLRHLKDSGIGNLTYSLNKCGHYDEPPVDDYIPQPFRWLTEWSEHFCMYQNYLLETMKNCENCKKENTDCKQIKHGACKECKEKCVKYKEFVDKWKTEYDVLEKAYGEIYAKATASSGTNTNDEHIKNFVEKLKEKCNDTKTSGEYLDKGNYCKKFTFYKTLSNGKNYAFEEAPSNYKDNCDCAKNFEEVDQCPVIIDVCNKYGRNGRYRCPNKSFNKNPIEWTNYFVKNNSNINKAVMVPPRRRQLCLRNLRNFYGVSKNKENLKEYLLRDAYNEAKQLWNLYSSDEQKALEAMKYSFADYGDIVKGTDMLNNLDILHNKLNELFKPNVNGNGSGTPTENRKNWWEENKEKVWNVMMCHYTGEGKTDTKCPKHDNIDKEDQFLRWLIEWAKYFCKEKVNELKELITKCKSNISLKKDSNVDYKQNSACKELSNKYYKWLNNRKVEWTKLSDKYDNDKSTNQKYNGWQSSAYEYVKSKCSECDCTFKELDELYGKNQDEQQLIKSLVQKNTPTTNQHRDSSGQKTDEKNTSPTTQTTPGSAEPNAAAAQDPPGPPSTAPASRSTTPTSVIPPSQPVNHTQTPSQPGGLPTSPQNDDPTSHILSSTLPVGISFALGSIALLFYLKKKPKIPVDIFRILEIPQKDSGMPTYKSTNRYVPYKSGHYAGKTYIYVERDDDSDYVRDISSSDVTTSSDSEYDEIDINDIYGYRSPKYKTLIDVILRPSTSGDTYSGNTIPSGNTNSGTMDIVDTSYSGTIPSDIPTNKLTDNEWNELKEDFILKMLQTHNMDIPANITDTLPNTSYSGNFLEKPFITSIQDRVLHGDNEIIYNIVWNVPKNISTNTVTYNSLYRGTDLINDSLSGDQHIDIYDELLKRKENELFGTKHPKNTSTKSVSKQIYYDPINNQIDLFHEWLDRHRYMCEKWNNKEEMLSKLYDEWNKSNNEHVLYIPLNDNADDINTINNENYNMINANKHKRNHKTSLEHLGSTNIPPNDLTTQNNGSQEKNLRTNVSINIHFDENNNNNNVLINNVTHEEDHLENTYNF
ncbi:erythrocyte membrane protein 1 (PfEMP1), truncated, putative [Plasmodium sp. DRC-Itaito]|nr:erythrocyte membrane protein 1 (PfEMP1), truncated, putative [Plasmodium sp. DRC-Itaito]